MPRTQSGLLAIEPGIRQTAKRAETDAYHVLQRPALLSGYSKTYTPKDDDADDWDRRPDEGVKVQLEAETLFREMTADLAKWFNTMALKEATNAVATADIIVDGETLLARVPTTYLLFLERQLVDLLTFVSKLPVLDPAENWGLVEGTTAWASTPVVTLSTKKVPRNHVLAAPTDKHPAQVQVYQEDVVVGRWTAVKFSGAVPAKRVAELTERVKKLQVAAPRSTCAGSPTGRGNRQQSLSLQLISLSLRSAVSDQPRTDAYAEMMVRIHSRPPNMVWWSNGKTRHLCSDQCA